MDEAKRDPRSYMQVLDDMMKIDDKRVLVSKRIERNKCELSANVISKVLMRRHCDNSYVN